jgi:lysozyme
MRLNKRGLELIKRFEGFSAKPYYDVAGIPTVGYGTTHYPNGRKVHISDTSVSEEFAEGLLLQHIENDTARLKSFLLKNDLVLSENQFSALLSFIYNVGFSPLTKGKKLHTALVNKKLSDVPEAMKLYDKATVNGVKKQIKGLQERRKAEVELFLCP